MLIRTFKQQNSLTCTQLDNIYSTQMGNRRMRTRMYGGVRGRKTKVGRKLLLFSSYSIAWIICYSIILRYSHIHQSWSNTSAFLLIFGFLGRYTTCIESPTFEFESWPVYLISETLNSYRLTPLLPLDVRRYTRAFVVCPCLYNIIFSISVILIRKTIQPQNIIFRTLLAFLCVSSFLIDYLLSSFFNFFITSPATEPRTDPTPSDIA